MDTDFFRAGFFGFLEETVVSSSASFVTDTVGTGGFGLLRLFFIVCTIRPGLHYKACSGR